MLSPDLVRARRKGDRLLLLPLAPSERQRALELAKILLHQAQMMIGQTREEWEEAIHKLLFLPQREKLLAMAFAKLIDDQSSFDIPTSEVSPEAIRQELFLQATIKRRNGSFQTPSFRESLLTQVGADFGLTKDQMEQSLYSDLKGSFLRTKAPACSPDQLLDLYEQSQAQAVLLRASSVLVEVTCASPKAYRTLFHKIKFLRLLASIQATEKGTYRIQIDGPFSLFESTVKYGLQLALLLPVLTTCSQFQLHAQIRWGKERVPLHFYLEHHELPAISDHSGNAHEHIKEELAAFLPRFSALSSPWQASISTEILHLPGIGICIPDLQFVQKETGEIIYFELLGFWSRDAVFQRIELVKKGLPFKILFAVSKRLRVSEKTLDEESSGMLYVFNEILHPKTINDQLHKLSQRKV